MIEEISEGDNSLVQKRNELIKEIPMLEYNGDVEKLAQTYFDHFKFPLKSLRDAFHMAFAVYYELDFLLTWNCKHLANANIRLELARFNFTLGYKTPDICTLRN